jgi:hypothetical protein
MFYYDSSFLLIIPALIVTIYAQWKVSAVFRKLSKVENAKGITGAEVAKLIMDNNALHGIPINRESGRLSDHYNPIKKSLGLSEEVHSGKSVAAIGIAAHEVGHALQHRDGFFFLNLRTAIYPVVSFGSWLAPLLIIAGIFIAMTNLIYIGIILFSASVFFTLITLPVEFDASKRAIVQIETLGLAQGAELKQVKKVLNAAAMTYVAAALTAILELLRLILIARSHD